MSDEQYIQLTKLFKQSPSYQRDRAIGDLYISLGTPANAVRSYNHALNATHDKNHQWELMHTIASLHFTLGEPHTAIGFLLIAHSLACDRPESLYLILDYLRNSNPSGCADLLQCLVSIKKNTNKYPGRIEHVHTYGIASLALIISFYCGISDVGKYVVSVLNECRTPNEYHHIINAFRNYRFYIKKLIPTHVVDISETKLVKLNDTSHELLLYSSTPSIVKTSDGFIVNKRFVNYKLNEGGTFVGPEIGYVYNLNTATVLNEDLTYRENLFISYPAHTKSYDKGPQDIRLWNSRGNILMFTCTTFREDINRPWVAIGQYTPDKLQNADVITHSLNNNTCEKNWVFVRDNTLIYSWSPLIVGNIDKTSFKKTAEIETPHFFSHFRGSSHAQQYGDNEILFVIHIVLYDVSRVYYHCFVTLDSVTLKPRRCSYPFKLCDKNVEYCAGLVVDDKKIIISYSCHDSTSFLATFNKSYVDDMLWML